MRILRKLACCVMAVVTMLVTTVNALAAGETVYLDNLFHPSGVAQSGEDRAFDYDVLGRLDELSRDEVDALALEYIAKTGGIGHVYNMSPFMSVAGRDAAVAAYLEQGGDIGLVGAMLGELSPAAAKQAAERYDAEKTNDIYDWIFAQYR